MFFEQPDFFVGVLRQIQQKDATSKKILLKSLKDAMQGTDLNYDKLFSFKYSDAKQLESAKESLRCRYDILYPLKEGLKIQKDNYIHSICHSLDALALKVNNTPTLDQSIDIAIRKTQLAKELHRHDALFKKHNNPFFDNVIRNLVAFLLTGGLAFVINRAVNGHCLFGQKTKTEKRVDAVDRALSYRSVGQ